MYALVEILGKQYKAEVGSTIQVDRIDKAAGEAVEFTTVLAVVDGENVKFGAPYVEGAKVVASLEEEVKGDKIRVYKFHKRKGYRRTQGHREKYSIIKVNAINA
ncbi:MAG: 50S ribosomal protein L21 [Sphaerochaetaceae bacterium]|jgi:large subunit ribosomal protein L21|nr:50S ribosomal protein L21 [Sphaerochaetaceae bacterium]NLY07159.1 50S ribosomal protein L21 [Spirochaetales bacterium]